MERRAILPRVDCGNTRGTTRVSRCVTNRPKTMSNRRAGAYVFRPVRNESSLKNISHLAVNHTAPWSRFVCVIKRLILFRARAPIASPPETRFCPGPLLYYTTTYYTFPHTLGACSVVCVACSVDRRIPININIAASVRPFPYRIRILAAAEVVVVCSRLRCRVGHTARCRPRARAETDYAARAQRIAIIALSRARLWRLWESQTSGRIRHISACVMRETLYYTMFARTRLLSRVCACIS